MSRKAFTLIDPRLHGDDHKVQRFARKSGFTLIELLVVIAIIAILAIVVVLTLNPVQLLQQSRDSDRLSDVATIQTAVNLFATDQPGTSLGSANTVYISIPDSVATTTAGDQCQGLSLPSLPSGYSYHCAASSTIKNVNGTGWIPVNFSSLSSGAPFSVLPIDPTNTSSSRLYYSYVTTGSQFEVTASMESSRYQLGGSGDVVSNDGGILASVYERGSKLGLEPLDYGDTSLMGLWAFTEGTGTVAYDYSGANATGSWSGAQVGTNGYYSTGKIAPWAGAFDGASTNVSIPSSAGLNITGSLTLSAWIYRTGGSSYQIIIAKRSGGASNYQLYLGSASQQLAYYDGAEHVSSYAPPLNTWTFVAATVSNGTVILYANGVQVYATSGISVATNAGTVNIGYDHVASYFTGLIDDARIYNRALTASQITAMYNGGK